MEWEKIKELITRLYMELKKLITPRINNPLNKWANKRNRQFSKEEVQMANKHKKKSSTSLAIKEMQMKTTMRFHFTSVKMATISNTNNDSKCWRGCGGKGTLLHC
jgi:hypothetical protein